MSRRKIIDGLSFSVDDSQATVNDQKPDKANNIEKMRNRLPRLRLRLLYNRTKIAIGMLGKWQKLLLLTLVTVYVIIPAIIFIFPSVASWIVLSYSVPFGNLKHPASYGIKAVRHLDIQMPSGNTIGLWHILPDSALDEERQIPETEFDTRLASGVPVFIYVHGSGGTRGMFNRIYMYTTLRGQNCHVIAFDFRGFGDSTGKSSEQNMVEDTVAVFQWVKEKASSSPIYLWGHSLGSGVAVHAARILSKNHEPLSGLVMEGAFSSLSDLLDVAWISLPYRIFPFVLRVIKNALQRESMEFRSFEHICFVESEVLILHAEDDQIVPVDLARKLFKAGMECRQNQAVKHSLTMHVFPARYGYGHNGLHRIPDLGNVLQKFLDDSWKVLGGPTFKYLHT